MRRICLALPTDRACAGTIAAVGREAVYAARYFDVEVHLLILDCARELDFAGHAKAVADLPPEPGVVVHHLGEADQRRFLRAAIERAGLAKPELMLELMLPDVVSYGACTNRAFLVAAALGCASVHRRDPDSSYQTLDGEEIFPVQHELMSLGRRAAAAADGVSANELGAADTDKPVALVGGSFIGELSVDVGEIQRLDPEVYHDLVGLWAPGDWTEQQKRDLADKSFKGAGTEPFAADHSVLTYADPIRLDMGNIGFDREVYERVPLPPATDTIGSDYFLTHLVHDARLPAVVHNRNIVTYYTVQRRTDCGFTAYQLRFAKFVLSMLYLNFVYARMDEAGSALLDAEHHLRPHAVAALARRSARLEWDENERRLDVLDRSYRRLGGKYAAFADHLSVRRGRLLAEAQADIEDFALLTEAWAPLVRAVRATPVPRSSW